ncbi:DUF6263 family protein [Synechococcus sp. RC10B2]|uniref:DUF6263 family protein n=1 Tax=Synechococcus sp. RC10B2 TaxID=2964530 RepID=UPI0039C75A95
MNVKEGNTFKYRSSMDIDFGGQPVFVTTTVTNKVVKVEENGNIQMESASSELTIKFGDQEMPQPAPPATKMTFKPNGAVAKVDGGDAMMQQMNAAQMVYPEKPVKVGDKWSETVKNAGGELKIDYEFVGVEKVEIKMTARSVNAKEGEGYSADGFNWIDPKTGMLVKMEARIKGMQVEGAPMPIDGTLKMELVK